MKLPVEPNKKVLGKVQLRGGFSDRNNINCVSTQIQLTDFDERTRTILYNKLQKALEIIKLGFADPYNMHSLQEMYLDVLENVYCIDITKIKSVNVGTISQIFSQYVESTIQGDTYDAILTLIEYIFNCTSTHFKNRYYRKGYSLDGISYTYQTFDEIKFMNQVFENECIGYRFVANRITKITDKPEIEEIEEAVRCEFEGCRTHINNAVNFLADRENPDYKNCIKESISAVESICRVITKNEHATLGDALKELEKKRNLKGPLKASFEKLYSYTNDQGGIRHSEGLFVSKASFEEAKFMLVSCSAFVNYLIAEYGKMVGQENA